MIQLTAVIITYNEEKNIGRCLASLVDIADEILVVDSFSTDKTKEICQSYGVRFIEHNFDGMIQQKNYAIAFATYDYVLSLDADEALSDKLRESIKKVKHKFDADGYYFNRLNCYCGSWIRHSGWYPDRKLRLWNRHKGHFGGENPHDKFILQNNTTEKYLKGDLLHYTYYTVHDHVQQMNKFTDIAASVAHKKGRKAPIIKVIVFPIWRFIRDYFIKAGFLDGFYGLVICSISAHFTFLKYVKIHQLNKKN